MSSGGFARAWATFLECGLLPVPIEPGGKRPLIKWGRWQHEPPAERELPDLARRFPGADIAVLLNAPPPYVQILDLDFDSGSLPSWAECSATFRSPRGAHALFLKPKMDLNYRRLPDAEVRVRGIVVVPPSTGRTWVLGLDQLKEPPPEVLRLLVGAPTQQPSSSQIREVQPKSVAQFFSAHGPWWPRIVEFLGLPPVLYRNLPCPVHPPDRHPSAQLLVSRAGYVALYCFHLEQTFTLAEIYARQRLRGPLLAVWSLRLAHAAGVLQIDVPPPPPELKDFVATKVLQGFVTLQALRSWPKRPTFLEPCPYTPGFAASWCSVSELQAKRALDFLCHQFWLSVERGARYRFFRIGPRFLRHLQAFGGAA
jgi:hypothetical protein